MSTQKKKAQFTIIETPQDMLKHIFAVAEIVANSKAQQPENESSQTVAENLLKQEPLYCDEGRTVKTYE